MDKRITIIVAGLLLLVAASFMIIDARRPESGPRVTGTEKLQVVTSFYPLYFLAAEIGGDQAAVMSITPAGVEPHDYEPTARDMAAIEDSDMLIMNGVGLEPWAEGLDLESGKIVVAGAGLATREMTEQGEQAIDPHAWLSPDLFGKMADRIAAAFVVADPAQADHYLSRAQRLKQELSALDDDYRQGLSACASRDIITAHAAFAYLAAAYGLEQVAISGLSPEAEPSPRAMADIVDFARENNVKYIFFESLASPKLAQTIADEIGAQTLVLNPLEGLTPTEVAAGEDYFSVMRSNLINLKTALGCQP